MTYRIPLFDLNYGQEERDAVIRTLDSRWISMGPNVTDLEAAFADHLRVEHAVALNSCTAALHLALRVLGVGPGDEVIVPSLTFVATANAVRYVGARPVFADVVAVTDLCLDPEDVEELITPRTRAIVAMHYAGFLADMEALVSIAERHGVAIVEDAAHAPDTIRGGRRAGTFGQVGCFSFFSNKNVSCAEGGLLVTSDESLAERARLLRSHGMTSLSYDRAMGHATSYDVVDIGFNYRLDDIRAGLALAQLRKLPDDTARRAEVRARYVQGLCDVPGLVVPFEDRSERSSNHLMSVVLEDGNTPKRDEVRRRLAEGGIETSVHYPPVHLFAVYRKGVRPLPRTEYVASNELTLPMFGGLTDADVATVCAALRAALEDS